MLNKKLTPRLLAILICQAITSPSSQAAIMREDVPAQEYRDFAENLGKYGVGKQDIIVFKSDGSVSGKLKFPIPDFGAIISIGSNTLTASSYLIGAGHETALKNVDFGNNAKFKTTYTAINLNRIMTMDFHLPRLNKVVTEATPIPYVAFQDLTDKSRYSMYARAGAGIQKQVDPITKELITLANGYNWKSGGGVGTVSLDLERERLSWRNYPPGDTLIQPLDNAVQSGDSGSPLLVYDNVEKIWKIVGPAVIVTGNSDPYRITSTIQGAPLEFIKNILAQNTDPDVTDTKANGTINWGDSAITQGSSSWQWHGVNKPLPTDATNEELDASKDLRFNGEGGVIVLNNTINLGAGKLQFSSDYTVTSAAGRNNTWVGGGVEVDAGKNVLWQVNGLAGDVMHKIGAGTLHVNASGVNDGGLNVGDGTVILDQQADASGNKQAFSTVTLVSGRPVVVLNSADQIASENIRFGYRGGTLDLNGNSLSFSEIQHNDNGARLVNRNKEQAATLTLTGNEFNFLGHLGEKESGTLNLVYNAPDAASQAMLSGGADVQSLTVERGGLVLSGQQTLHAGNVYFNNDWTPQAFNLGTVQVNSGTSLTLHDHADVVADTTVAAGASLEMHAHTQYTGNVQLTGTDSVLDASIMQRDSIMGPFNSTINGNLSGDGQLIKTGSGYLILNGDVTTRGDIELREGLLSLNGTVTPAVNMASGTRLSGNASLTTLNTVSGTILYPGALLSTSGEYATLRTGELNTQGTTTLALNSAFSRSATDKLRVDGNISGSEPIQVRVNGRSRWADSDSNHNGNADNTEGVSIIQVGGNANKDSFKLADGYVARGPWAYGLYAFAPGKSAESEREVGDAGSLYWDYRLQNIRLYEGDNTIPGVPEESEEEPDQPHRRALIPQVPAYISLPSALFRAEEQRSALFRESALDAVQEGHSRFFLFNYRGDEHYQSGNSFMDYGYNYKSRFNGWMMGASFLTWQDADQSLNLSAAWSKGSVNFSPSAADGYSQGNFSSDTLNLMLAWQKQDLYLNLITGYGWADGQVATGLRGQTASPEITQWYGEVEAGKIYTTGAQRIRPYLSYRYQQMDINRFTDVDEAQVSYQSQHRDAWTGGVAYDYALTAGSLGTLRLGADASLTLRPDNQGKVTVGDGFDSESFLTGNGGNSLNLKTQARLELNNNVALTTQIRHQRKLQQEGANDWMFSGGVNISF